MVMSTITVPTRTKTKFSILIVDDHPDNLRTLSVILRDEMYSVRQAINGEVALGAVQANPPDLILLDIRMPKMDGYKVCSILKANSATRDIPVIFLSALNDVSDKVKAFAAGAADYITKPFQAEEVLVRIGHQLTIRHQHQQLLIQNQQLQETKDILRFQAEQERLMGTIIQRIRQSLDKEVVFSTTVAAIKQLLQADRVLIYQFFSDGTGKVVAEAVVPIFPVILGMDFPEEVFPLPYHELYKHGRICIINDIHAKNADIAPCLVEFVEQWAVRAKLVVPILIPRDDPGVPRDHPGVPRDHPGVPRDHPGVPRQEPGNEEKLWGLLIIHHCSSARVWHSSEVSLLFQLAGQIAIAIQQAELYQEIQHFNTNLERQVYVRTLELQQSLTFEATLKRISDKVRDSLDSHQILQVAVKELAVTIEAKACDAALYSLDRLTSIIHYQYVQPGLPATQGQKIQIKDTPEIYGQLQQGYCFAFCQIQPSSIRNYSAILVCPIFDGQWSQPKIIGDLWVFKPIGSSFSEMEIHLVQQVANQCAIALRQARLYEAAQAQVKELQRLNQLKDDFLGTISHELRTPISNMKLILQLLTSLTDRGQTLSEKITGSTVENNEVAKYFGLLRQECDRELHLIEDLLNLQHLEAGVYPLQPSTIRLQDWIPHIAEDFESRAQTQQQTLRVEIDPDLPPTTTDISSLNRVVTELLTNACKYTPSGGTITVRAFISRSQGQPWEQGTLHLSVSNTGITIPAEEQSRIFDKFYRIPSNDPWKHDGTGLGLALVKKLVEQINGSIQVESDNNHTCFIVQWLLG